MSFCFSLENNYSLEVIVKILLAYFMNMDVLSACISVRPVHSGCPRKPEESVGPLRPELQALVSCHVGAGH